MTEGTQELQNEEPEVYEEAEIEEYESVPDFSPVIDTSVLPTAEDFQDWIGF